jgi:hypothetical protein
MARSDQASGGAAVTPSDTVNIGFTTFGLWVGGAGNVVVVWPDGSTSTFTAVAAGTLLPIQVIRVNATLTTATLMVALKQ